jgi:hypothetical protein
MLTARPNCDRHIKSRVGRFRISLVANLGLVCRFGTQAIVKASGNRPGGDVDGVRPAGASTGQSRAGRCGSVPATGIPFHLVLTSTDRRRCIAVSPLRLRRLPAAASCGGAARQFSSGVLNLHCGSLPAVQGMNGVEWNLFSASRRRSRCISSFRHRYRADSARVIDNRRRHAADFV